MFVLAEGGKQENQEKNPRCKAKINNKLYTHGIVQASNQGRIGGRQVLSPLYHPCYFLNLYLFTCIACSESLEAREKYFELQGTGVAQGKVSPC